MTDYNISCSMEQEITKNDIFTLKIINIKQKMSMTFIIRSTLDTYKLNFQPSDSVLSIKYKLSELTGIPTSNIHIYNYNGVLLTDKTKVCELEMNDKLCVVENAIRRI